MLTAGIQRRLGNIWTYSIITKIQEILTSLCWTVKLCQSLGGSRMAPYGNKVKGSGNTSSGEPIKPDLHNEGPGLDTSWALFCRHPIRGVGCSYSTPVPSVWLCPDLCSFFSIHDVDPPSSNPNLRALTTPSPRRTKGLVQHHLPSIPIHNAMGQIRVPKVQPGPLCQVRTESMDSEWD